MALAPLPPRSHTIAGRRLAFTTPVREAGAGGHWVTLHAHGEGGGEEEGEGTCHVFILDNGRVSKGPRSLLGSHIGALAGHASVSKAQHHPVGHEPAGARAHPHYAEADPHAARPTPPAAGEPAKRAGKPYARLSGAEQGTRSEQIGKALKEAQGAARGARAQPERSAHDLLAQAKARGTSPWLAKHREIRQERQVQHTVAAHSQKEPHEIRFVAGNLEQSAQQTAQRPAVHGDVLPPDAQREAARRLRAIADRKEGHKTDKIADAAVQAQQAQAELAQHRAAHDRNPNPWAPHLSPPVGDARDKELAEQATRAQVAHQQAQEEQQSARQQEQQEGQRQHEREMAQLKAGQRFSEPHKPAQAPQRRDEPILWSDGTYRTREQYDMAHAAGQDQANMQMRKAGRTAWNEDDYNLAARTMNDLLDRNLHLSRGPANDRAAERAARKATSSAPEQPAQQPRGGAPQQTEQGARTSRASAADKQAALEHVNRELGDPDVHAPQHKELTRRIRSGDLHPREARAAVDAAYDVARTPPVDWDRFGDSIHHLQAMKVSLADRRRDQERYLKEHRATPKRYQIYPQHQDREHNMKFNIQLLKEHQERIEQAIARHKQGTVRESASPAPRFVAPALAAR